MKKKLKIMLGECITNSKILETDERGVTQELKNISAVKVNVDVMKPESLKATMEFQVGYVEVETDNYNVVTTSKKGELKQVAKIIYKDGSV